LVEKADAALTEVAESIPESAEEPSKTVFGVPASWVENGRIKKPHLEKIRLVSKKLSLSPTGFVVLPEAIAHAVKIREGSPLSGVIIGVGKGSLDLTVFRLGNIVGTVSVGRSTSLIEDMMEGLSRFASTDSIPTRWLLYDGRQMDLEEIKQELIKTDWSEAGNLKFLHTPQVEIVGDQAKVEAVSIAGASEIGDIKGVEGESGVAEPEDDNVSETGDLAPEDLGFIVDRDIRSEHFGQKADIAPAARRPPLGRLSSLLLLLKKFKVKLPKGVFGRKRIGAVLAVVLLVGVGGLLAAWLWFSRAEVSIYISPKNLQEVEVVILDTNANSPDLGNFTFPAEAVEVEVFSEKTRPTTGTKTVGERAKGFVTIRNGTADEVEFDQGTTLTGSNDLEFSLEESIVVPEASSPTSPGEASVAATAADFGEEYNLEADGSFSVANFPKSEIDAVNEEEFSGGSSREVRVVSEVDIKGLRDELRRELETQAQRSLESRVSEARFVPEATEFEVVDESGSQSAGDEVDEVTISMTLSATGLVLKEEQITQMSSLILRDQIPEGFSLRSEQVEADFEFVSEVADGVWESDATLSANLLPSIDTGAVQKDVAGKSPKAVEAYLATIPGYERAVIVLRPKLPGFLGNLPRVAGNITIEVVAER
jgi:hypothetical protein